MIGRRGLELIQTWSFEEDSIVASGARTTHTQDHHVMSGFACQGRLPEGLAGMCRRNG
jgi:hypothetical protein